MLEALLAVIGGCVLGMITGLVPGLHPNTIASILFIVVITSGGNDFVVLLILSTSIVHTFVNIIPSVLLGAPEGDTALAVLPGHKLLLQGRGMEAIELSAMGSICSLFVSFALIPFFVVFLFYFYDDIRPHLWMIITGIVAVMILTEFGGLKKKLYSLIVILLSGYLGMLAFNNEPLMTPLFSTLQYLHVSSPLIPLLNGLFGASTLVVSLVTGRSSLPPQRHDFQPPSISKVKRGVITGTLAGAFVSWIPGLSPSIGTVLAYLATSRKELSNKAEDYIVAISGVNTSDAIFSLLTLWLIEKARSGTLIVIDELMPSSEWSLITIVGMMGVVILSSICGYYTTIKAGGLLSRVLSEMDMRIISGGVIVLLASISFVFGGIFGLSLFLCAIPIGIFAILCGVRRSNAMGVVLVPVLVSYIKQSFLPV